MGASWYDGDLSFDSAAERIIQAHHQDGESRDLPIPDLRTWGIVPLEGRFGLAPLGHHHPPRPLRSAAFSNLAARLGAPVEFVRDRLPQPLQLATMNWLLSASDQAVAGNLRLRGDEVAALVSDRYAPLDAEELLSSVRNALIRHGAIDDVRVRSVATGLVDVIRLVFPSEATAVKVGDISALGVDISSSSFGKSAVHIKGIIWRLRCTNGLRVAEAQGSFSFRHVGESQRLRDGISEAIPAALVAARGTMGRWKAAVNVMVENVADQVERLRELTMAEKQLVATEVKKAASSTVLPDHMSLYELVNAVTAAAHDVAPARRIEIESLAGEMLIHPKRGTE
jgi:hypothetical protein